MNKSDLVTALAAKANLTNTQAAQVVAALFDGEAGIIASALNSGTDVALQGFGTFRVKARAARVATNPATGGKVNVPAKNAVTFKVGKSLATTIA